MPVEVRMADHYGMCFGVRDAIDMALDLADRSPITILGDLVHNPAVVAQLDNAGAHRAQAQEDIDTPSVLLTAHGTSDRVKLELTQAGKQVHDATCPLVTRAHKAVQKLVEDGYFPVVIGKRDHVEVRGLVGDYPDHLVVSCEDELATVIEKFPRTAGPAKVGLVAQTTWPLEKAQALVEALRARASHLEIRFADTVCQPTKDRQQAVRELTKAADVIIVVGGPASNNSRKLAELARRLGCPAYRVSNASELRREWFANARVVGLTAGTSTPDDLIDETREHLQAMEPVRDSGSELFQTSDPSMMSAMDG